MPRADDLARSILHVYGIITWVAVAIALVVGVVLLLVLVRFRSRDDAFHHLLEVAAFFQRTEPHSIVPYALEQVVRWCRTPLPDLLTELIPDDTPRNVFFKQVGIRVTEATRGGD